MGPCYRSVDITLLSIRLSFDMYLQERMEHFDAILFGSIDDVEGPR